MSITPETYQDGNTRITLYDLSDCLENSTSAFELNKHNIDYTTPQQGAQMTERMIGLGASYWPDGVGWAVESVTLSTHSGTHVDAPAHYGPAAQGETRTIDRVPLRWCFSDGVLLDMTYKKRGEGITDEDVQKALATIGYTLKPYDIILIRTDTSKHFKEPGYDMLHAGLRRSATEWLVDQGVRLIGIDAWGIDRPFDVMVQEAKAGESQFWESHLLGRQKEYCQIEKLANLDQLPKPFGFKVAAFPVNLKGASAGWSRVVAIFEEAM